VLARVLADLEVYKDPRVMVGFETADDAGVYLLNEDLALVQTVDFFTPVVDDPHDYGRIAAANALSDIYAMGARPIFALSVVGFAPGGDVDEEVLAAVLRGGAGKMSEARVPVIGGHSVQDPEMKIGYCVTGTVDPRRVWTNAGARPGDVLFLTKPLGTGIITTGVKYGKTPRAVLDRAVGVMLELNSAAQEAVLDLGVHGATDVTGYGLVGHAFEMARASGATLSIEAAAVPLIDGVAPLARKGMLPGGILSNEAYAGSAVDWGGVAEPLRQILLDPQTSGGLLLAVDPADAETAAERLGPRGWRIGRVLELEDALIRFE
jgi:selenide, water dikinase